VCFTLLELPTQYPAPPCLLHTPSDPAETFFWPILPEGNYTLVQTLVPGGPYHVIGSLTIGVDAGHRDHSLTNFTALKEGSITIEKLDKDGNLWAEPLPEVTFEIYRCADASCDVLQVPFTTTSIPDAGNPATLDLPEGWYLVREIVPEGYLATANDLVVELTADTDPVVSFTNSVPEGCSPGYWRNHFDQWPIGYSPSDSFNTVFDVSFFSGDEDTLGNAIDLNGGGRRKLARHGTGALLNAAHLGVAYPYSVDEVISLVRSGMGGNGEPEASLLAEANTIGCPLP
jgi:hypothetical protein